jgi:exonuclease III
VELAKWDADIIFLQETKCEEFPPEIKALNNYSYKKLCTSTGKKGHAGIAMLSKEKPISLKCGLGDHKFDQQARLIQAEFQGFYVIGWLLPDICANMRFLIDYVFQVLMCSTVEEGW